MDHISLVNIVKYEHIFHIIADIILTGQLFHVFVAMLGMKGWLNLEFMKTICIQKGLLMLLT